MKLKVLSANLWLLPPPTSFDNNKRLERFIRLAKKIDADIISLQEVWLNEYVAKLKKGLSKYFVVSPRSIIFNKSGLVTLSKAKPVSWKYHAHKPVSGIGLLEKFADKGFLEIKVSFSGHEVIAVNTHIYQSQDEHQQKIKLEQTKGVMACVNKHNPTIVSGDFNLKPPDFLKFIGDMIRDKDFVRTYLAENKYTFQAFNQILNWSGIYNDTPDYVFLNSKSKTAKVKSEVISKPLVSDHYPILSEITL